MRRRRGDGTVYKRKEGRYEAAIYVNTPQGIRRVRRYAQTRSEAEAILVELRNKNVNGILTSSKEQKFGDYLDYWLLKIKPSIRIGTYYSYETTVRLYLKPGLGHKSLTKINVSDVQMFLDEQGRLGKSNRNLQKMRMVVSAALSMANREERLTRNVARYVKTPTYRSKEVEPWSLDELGQFLSHSTSHKFHSIFILMALYGLRTGEVLGLSWSDVDFVNRIIYVHHQVQYREGGYVFADVKTQAGRRSLPLLDTTVDALIVIKKNNLGPLPDLIFKTETGLPIDGGNLRKALKRLSKEAGLPIITLHHLRHTAATNLKDLGVPAKDAQSILGHANVSTTMQIYQHANIDGKSKALTHYEQQLADFSACSRQIKPSTEKAIAQNNDFYSGTPNTTRTCDLRLRSPLLYPAELSGRILFGDLKNNNSCKLNYTDFYSTWLIGISRISQKPMMNGSSAS